MSLEETLSGIKPSFLLRLPVKVLRRWRVRFGRLYDGSPVKDSPIVVFIGFNRTATKALHHFFSRHGYPSVHMDSNRLAKRILKNLDKQKPVFRGYDREFKIFSDLILATESQIVECNRFFRQMHADYPMAKFILNTRPTPDWIRSRLTFKGGDFLRRQLNILGTNITEDCVKFWQDTKENHENEVRTYFAQHPTQFLELNVSSDNVPAELSRFLGKQFDSRKWESIDF